MKTEGKGGWMRTVSNNYFIIQLVFRATPLYGASIIVEAIRHNLVNFLEQTICVYLILDAIETGKPYTNVLQVVGLFLILDIVAAAVSNLYEQRIKLKYLPVAQKSLKEMLYDKAGKVDLSCYDDVEYYDDFMLSVSEADRAIGRAEQLIRMFFGSATILICYGTFFVTQDISSVIFVILSFGLRTIFSNSLNKWNYKIRQKENPLERKREYIKRIFYLKQYAKELRLNKSASKQMHEEFDRTNEELYELNRKMGKRRFFLDFVAKYLVSDFALDIVYVLYLILKAVMYRTISFSSVVVLYNSAANLRRGFGTVVNLGPYALETSLYVEKIRAFLAKETELQNNKTHEVPCGAGVIECRNVSFGYQKDHMILKNVSFKIEANEKVALVGYNGAGKTTLIKLLLRLYDPTEGEILLDGVNIKNYDINEYRQYIGVVFQDFQLFAATVEENVVMDCPVNGSETKVLEAIQKSGFSDKLKTLPKGIKQELTREFSEDGVELSGGEEQKLAVARAFYKDAGIVFLDEPSSALDPLAEYQFNMAMQEVAKEKTVLTISHRLSTTRHADCIFVMEQGAVVEQGSHEQLLSRDGVYAAMWKVQAGRYM